jgi:hypothetical protein
VITARLTFAFDLSGAANGCIENCQRIGHLQVSAISQAEFQERKHAGLILVIDISAVTNTTWRETVPFFELNVRDIASHEKHGKQQSDRTDAFRVMS